MSATSKPRHSTRAAGSSVDYPAVAIEQAKRKAQTADLTIDFRLGDKARPLPLPDACFGAVMSNLALHSFTDQGTRQIHRRYFG